MKKILTLIISLLIFASVSCSGNTTSETPVSTADMAMLYLKEADITMSEDFKTIISLDKLGEQVLVFGTGNNSGYMGYVTDKSFADHRKFAFTPKENEVVKSACLCKFSKTAVVTLLDNELMLYVFNSDGDVCNEYNLGEHEFDTEMAAIITANGEDYIINLNNESLLAVAADGTVQGEIDCKGGNILGFSKDNADVPTVILGYGDTAKTASINGTSLENERKCGDISSSAYAICGGNDEYSLFVNFNDGLYGLKENNLIKLTDYVDNSFSALELWGLQYINENEFAALIKKDGEQRLILLTERDISEIKTRKTLTLAVFGDANTEIGNEIKTFNNTNENYRIEIKTYNGGNFIENTALMRDDILSGNTPDIIQNNPGQLSPDSFGARESLFVDMYEFIDNDPNLSREDFVDGFLEGMDFNGKLLEISPGFTVNTMTVKDKYLNGLTSWTFDDMVNIINSRPDGMGIVPNFDIYTRSVYMINMIDYCSFIDFENATCRFDSDEFINIMKLVQENEIGMTVAESNSYIGNENSEFSNGARDFIDDNYLINVIPLRSAQDIQSVVKGEFNEPCTFIGCPTKEGAGSTFSPDKYRSFSIMRSCEHPEGAWEFIRDSFFTDSFYNSWSGSSCFPALESSFTEKFEAEKNVSMYEDPATGETENGDFYIIDTIENAIYFDPFNDSEVKKYSEFVRNAAKHRRRYDFTVWDILDEDLTLYFEGERSAEETAEVIQNRVSIYVSENYG
ncbi:MAG: hypothetical protein J6B75_05215 [Ruminococcus sp.]|nr:hypothetical protein [Ruminococcus sp.]